MKKTVPIIGMACSACSANVQRKLDELEGINQANVNLVGRSAFIDFDETSSGAVCAGEHLAFGDVFVHD